MIEVRKHNLRMEKNIETKEKDLRMVFWVPYNISEIQKGIQAGHCALEYSEEMNDESGMDGFYKQDNVKQYKEFIDNHKTWMIYNGGTTNSMFIEKGLSPNYTKIGSLNNIETELKNHNLICAKFCEPDLNNALTAICCIIDYNELDFETPLEELDEISLDYFIRTQRFA